MEMIKQREERECKGAELTVLSSQQKLELKKLKREIFKVSPVVNGENPLYLASDRVRAGVPIQTGVLPAETGSDVPVLLSIMSNKRMDKYRPWELIRGMTID